MCAIVILTTGGVSFMIRRQQEIINEILSSSQEVTGSALAKEFSLSLRSIRSDIKTINEILATRNVGIVSTKRGYMIDQFDKQIIVDFLLNLNKNFIPQTKNERSISLLLNLIFKDYSIEDASNLLLISDSSTQVTINQIKSLLKEWFPNIQLIQNSQKKWRLLASNYQKAHLLASLLSHNSNYEIFSNYLSYLNLSTNFIEVHKKIHCFLYDFFTKQSKKISSSNLFFLSSDLISLTLIRVYSIEGLHTPKISPSMRDFFQKMMTELNKIFHFDYSISEYSYLMTCLFSKFSKPLFVYFDEESMLLEDCIMMFIDNTEATGLSFNSKEKLQQELFDYLYPSILRRRNHFYIENQKKNVLLNRYPQLFFSLRFLFYSLKDQLNITLINAELADLTSILFSYCKNLDSIGKKILIISDYELSEEAAFQNTIVNLLDITNSQVETFTLNDIRFKSITKDYDLVISTIRLEKDLLAKLTGLKFIVVDGNTVDGKIAILKVWKSVLDYQLDFSEADLKELTKENYLDYFKVLYPKFVSL